MPAVLLAHPRLRLADMLVAASGVAQLKHYRFWSSSLLWVYDGGLSDPDERTASLDIRMIDFANTIYLRGETTGAALRTVRVAGRSVPSVRQ